MRLVPCLVSPPLPILHYSFIGSAFSFQPLAPVPGTGSIDRLCRDKRRFYSEMKIDAARRSPSTEILFFFSTPETYLRAGKNSDGKTKYRRLDRKREHARANVRRAVSTRRSGYNLQAIIFPRYRSVVAEIPKRYLDAHQNTRFRDR